MKRDNSTDARRQRGGEFRVVLVLLLLLGGLELAFRSQESKLSKDVAHLKALPEVAERIKRFDGFRVLVVGNSLARCGIDGGLLARGLEQRMGGESDERRGVQVSFFIPDASAVKEWAWGYERYFVNAGAQPDLVIVVTGRSHLYDSPVLPEKLGAWYVGEDHWREALAMQATNEDAIRLVLGKNLALFANRDRVRPLVFYRYLPGFEEAWPRLLRGATDEASQGETGAANSPNSPDSPFQGLDSLRRIIRSVEGGGGRMVVAAVPMPEPYVVPGDIRDVLAGARVAFLDLSKTSAIEATRFPDGYHLDAEGARIFTEALLEELR